MNIFGQICQKYSNKAILFLKTTHYKIVSNFVHFWKIDIFFPFKLIRIGTWKGPFTLYLINNDKAYNNKKVTHISHHRPTCTRATGLYQTKKVVPEQQGCTRATELYQSNRVVPEQQSCTRATGLYQSNRVVPDQQNCTRATGFYQSNRVVPTSIL